MIGAGNQNAARESRCRPSKATFAGTRGNGRVAWHATAFDMLLHWPMAIAPAAHQSVGPLLCAHHQRIAFAAASPQRCSGGSLISPPLYSRTKEGPDRLRTEVRIDQAKSDREGIMSGAAWASEIWGGVR